jgi:hypothetical protein
MRMPSISQGLKSGLSHLLVSNTHHPPPNPQRIVVLQPRLADPSNFDIFTPLTQPHLWNNLPRSIASAFSRHCSASSLAHYLGSPPAIDPVERNATRRRSLTLYTPQNLHLTQPPALPCTNTRETPTSSNLQHCRRVPRSSAGVCVAEITQKARRGIYEIFVETVVFIKEPRFVLPHAPKYQHPCACLNCLPPAQDLLSRASKARASRPSSFMRPSLSRVCQEEQIRESIKHHC